MFVPGKPFLPSPMFARTGAYPSEAPLRLLVLLKNIGLGRKRLDRDSNYEKFYGRKKFCKKFCNIGKEKKKGF